MAETVEDDDPAAPPPRQRTTGGPTMSAWRGSGFSSVRDVITYVAGLGVVGYGLVVREAAIVVAGIGVLLGPPALMADRKRQDGDKARGGDDA